MSGTGREHGGRLVAAAVAAGLLTLLGLLFPSIAWAAPSEDVTLSCSGNTLTGTVVVTGAPAGTSVTLRLEVQDPGWRGTPLSTTVRVLARQTSYSFTFDVSAYQTAKAYRLESTLGGSVKYSPRLDRTACAPPSQVPEVPAPIVIPLTFVATIMATEAVRRSRRRTSELAGA